MKDIQVLEVRQVRIFAADVLPFASFVSRPVGKAFMERFGWAEVTTPSPGEIRFGTGHFPSADATGGTVIKSLDFSERKIVLAVVGDSPTATTVYDGLVDFLTAQTGLDAWKTSPLVLTHETHCVVRFDFDWRALLAPAFTSFVADGLLPGLSSSDGQATIATLKLGVELKYSEIRSDLREHGVALADKTVTIEPRAGTPLSERRFFTTSPADSETHLRLLGALEKAITKKA